VYLKTAGASFALQFFVHQLPLVVKSLKSVGSIMQTKYEKAILEILQDYQAQEAYGDGSRRQR
jgi:hypothetical protein